MLGAAAVLDHFDVWIPTALVSLFGSCLLIVISKNTIMFRRRHGRMHTSLGFMYLVWIFFGYFDVLSEKHILKPLVFHIVLGVIGIFLTLAAAFEFKHKNVKNAASGILDEHALVSYGEMIEHSFYQGVNLVQILFFHSIYTGFPVILKLLSVFLVTSPWLFRDLFPVNKFSDNYDKTDANTSTFIRLMYRIKKYQYVFYKHFVLHGLNISAAIDGLQLVLDRRFRLFWLFLNTSYVMDFFLQTLVKKRYMKQNSMLVLQQILMLASSISAFSILRRVDIAVAFCSLVLNFANRKHDVFNTMIVAVVAVFILR